MDEEGPEECEPIASEFERVREKAAGLVNQMLGEGVVKAKREAGHFAFSISALRAKMLSLDHIGGIILGIFRGNDLSIDLSNIVYESDGGCPTPTHRGPTFRSEYTAKAPRGR